MTNTTVSNAAPAEQKPATPSTPQQNQGDVKPADKKPNEQQK
jgi:hypothetical protein